MCGYVKEVVGMGFGVVIIVEEEEGGRLMCHEIEDGL